ncbi:dehydrogenase [Rhizobium sp. Leaf306]|uniref:zinc-dependent alcohol dehydrogenase n=1 Tax=Rhizobium sp. Leaf306 TaxID=1736330 RepID=UPI000712EFB6|nr:zinc-binding alcohol dehydrogenase [Rhizobium sp. Leaf306]KQQ34952.1 dehydrogenase [Rhizobium sp. Leaf306]
MTIAQALWLVGANQPELRETPLGPLGLGDVLLESQFGAISRGTESLVAAGSVPESEYDSMRAPLQDGEFPFPIKYGYAVVGTVKDGPEALVDRTVFCLYPHQDVFHAPAEMAVPVPDGVPASRAVLAANMETALNGVWDAGILPGDKVVVVGAGLVGLLIAYLAARIPGTEVTVVDVNGDRRGLAEDFGCRFASPEQAKDRAGGCDVVIHTSATAAGLATSIALAGFEARIVEMSWYGEGSVKIPLGGRFHSQRLSIVASQVGNVPVQRRARWPLSRRLAAALALLADDRLDKLFSGETDFPDLAQDYCQILADPGTLCHRIRYR